MTWQSDIRNNKKWFGFIYDDSSLLVIKISEPLIGKERSWKAEGVIEYVINNNNKVHVTGKLIVYFSRDSVNSFLQYGDKILIKKKLQEIRNSGNPETFNYRRYAAFQNIHHTVFLKSSDYILLKEKDIDPFRKFIYSSREFIVTGLQKYLSKDQKIYGIAEALIIGIKQDLDKDLVQAYSNTGVVHIIAISGLHLGLIYFVLFWLLNRISFLNKMIFIKVTIVLGSLWLFAILTGSSASVLRSAVMFSFILVGNSYFKSSSIYNALTLSAFILLCYNPYFLWDVGFQLSYLAVIGIVWLQRPIYLLLFLKNKFADKIWNMAAVTIAAQVAAFPICIYYFHQFPVYFLFANLVAVPLSTVILFAEILLLFFSWFETGAFYAGKIISFLIYCMNKLIQYCSDLPYSVINEIYADILSTWLLYGGIVWMCSWLLYKNKLFLYFSMVSFVLFSFQYSYTRIKTSDQFSVIVYNVPRMQAIDIIRKNEYYFVGDSSLKKDKSLQNFHLAPFRINKQVKESLRLPMGIYQKDGLWNLAGIRLLIIDRPVSYEIIKNKVKVDILVISKSPSIHISQIIAAIEPSLIVFDSSNSLWKIAEWKKECSSLLLRFHSVPDQGAYLFEIK